MPGSGPRAFVIGHPVAHSRSPIIHGHWLAEHGLPGTYERIDVPPDRLAGFVRGFQAAGYVGGNVTVPHKTAVLAALDEPSAEAVRLRSANTLSLGRDGRVHGTSTDGAGFVASLDQEVGPGWEDGPALVVGAGGAAAAIVAALLDRGVPHVEVVNRTLERAHDLRRLDPARVSAATAASPDRLAATRIVVNATVLGMAGQPPLLLDLARLPRDAIVADIVYVPAETPFLAAARTRGLRTVGGLGMLLHQAVPGFELWFGVRPLVTPALRARVEADIAGRP